MDPVVGIFSSSKSAHEAAHRLHGAGFSKDRISLLLPGAASPTPRTLEAQVPTDDAEQPGVGQAIGGVVGATAGASAGFGAGALVASLLVPGVGAVTAIGLAAAALLGAAGAVGGVKAGEALENTRQGIPKGDPPFVGSAVARGGARGVVGRNSRHGEGALRCETRGFRERRGRLPRWTTRRARAADARSKLRRGPSGPAAPLRLDGGPCGLSPGFRARAAAGA
jgi:hypothetical protein